MRKVYDRLIQCLGYMLLSVTLIPWALGLLFFGTLVIGIDVFGWEPGPDRDARAVAVLENAGLSAYREYAPYQAMTIDDSLTAFVMPRYDNYTDKTDLRAGIIASATELPGWYAAPVSCDAYAARMNDLFPEAAFLLPADVTFDAWYEDADRLVFFDQDTGLMVHLQPDAQPRAGRIKTDGITIPHNGFVYEQETHSGPHGDGTTYRALIVPEDKRAAFESDISRHADWHEGDVTPAEYAYMHLRMFYELPELLPDPGITFDWWLHVDDHARSFPEKTHDNGTHLHYPAVLQEAGAVYSLNWHIALYDADTGLFVYYEKDC